MRNKIILLLLLLCVFSIGLSISGSEVVSKVDATSAINSEQDTQEAIDYAGNVKLDMNSETLKAEVDVKLSVDGDTVHFNINEPSFAGSVLKARFLAVNTPESTGQIEEYGKTASDFTKSKVMNAVSIIVESDTTSWNADSTGDRYLVWVWYKPSANEDYRNLNIELLQNGLAIASNSSQNRYGSICMDAINQAKSLGLNVHSGKPDPNFYYGEAIELDIKGLRMDIANYVGKKVAFEGVVYRDSSNTVYVEEYDDETGIYYGIAVYYGFNTS
jgi:endonuclease YncB( thermonuclease family)